MKAAIALFILAVATSLGCDSLVSGSCQPGYAMAGGQCIARDAVDGGVETDAGTTDGGTTDGGTTDGGTTDGGMTDGGTTDGMTDGGMTDGGTTDGGMTDGGMTDGGMTDGGMTDGGTTDGGTDGGMTCSLDLSTDPDHCGVCGNVCASGICATGHCAGVPWGHVVAIGHDYVDHNAAMARLLGNAAALGSSFHLTITAWPTAGDSDYATVLATSLATLGRPWTSRSFPGSPSPTAFDGIDVVVVGPAAGSGDALEAAATPWAASLDAFLRRGGVVIVLEGVGGQNHRFARGAGLFTTGTPVDAGGMPVVVVAPGDAVAQQVATPYLAESSSVSFPGATGAVVTTTTGQVVVFHHTR